LYKDSYQGWYSTTEETFLSETQVTQYEDKNGQCITISRETGNVVDWTREENYMFRLSHFSDRLLDWFRTNQAAVYPSMYAFEMKQFISDGLADLSVSRQSSRLHWGIPVPDDPSHVVSLLDRQTTYSLWKY
jgi:methionyl-tRNA synthetase